MSFIITMLTFILHMIVIMLDSDVISEISVEDSTVWTDLFIVVIIALKAMIFFDMSSKLFLSEETFATCITFMRV